MKSIPFQNPNQEQTAIVEGFRSEDEMDYLAGDPTDRNDFVKQRRWEPAAKSIIVPVTLSSASRAALAIAGNLAREWNAKLVLLHAVHLNIAGEERGVHRTRLVTELCHNAEVQLRELAGCLGEESRVDILVCEGRPAEAIIETARRLQAEAIVMSTHGLRGWRRWLHRNTAAKVMTRASCRVCLVSPGVRKATVNLMIVDRATISTRSSGAASAFYFPGMVSSD